MPEPVLITPSETPEPQVEVAAPVTSKAPVGSRFFSEYYVVSFLFLIVAFIGAAFLVLRPLIESIKETNAQTEMQLATIEQERSYFASLEQSVAAAQSIPLTTLDQVNRALPRDTRMPELLVQFGAAAARNQLRIDSISFNPTHTSSAVKDSKATTANLIAPMDITLAIHARNYFDMKRFLTDVETSLRLIDVMGMTTSGVGSDLTYTLQLRTYSFTKPARTVSATEGKSVSPPTP
ncbi:type 4a pilus biogenesis protein PilO [Patescibacteria group bacterium]|nr:type 4a pilus biogenesis protein PilO [Patescibacteria group bacterium]